MKTLFVRQQVQDFFSAHPAKFALFKQIVLKQKSPGKEEVPSLRNIELFCKRMHRLDPGRFKSYGGKRPPRDCMKRMRAEQSRFTKRLFDVYARQYPSPSPGSSIPPEKHKSCSSMTVEGGCGQVLTSLGQGNFFRFFFEEGLDDVIKGFGGVKQALASLPPSSPSGGPTPPPKDRGSYPGLSPAALAARGAPSRSMKDDGVFCRTTPPVFACGDTSMASPRGATSSAGPAETPSAPQGWAASAPNPHPANKRRRKRLPGISTWNVST